MTQEQQTKLEQAAHDHAKQYRSQVSLEGMENISSDFKAGAKTILDNPQEWFPPVQYWQLRDENERLQSELFRYREALERAYNDFKSSRWTEETYKIVIEALKNNGG